jgi:hypothetical protein
MDIGYAQSKPLKRIRKAYFIFSRNTRDPKNQQGIIQFIYGNGNENRELGTGFPVHNGKHISS